MYTEMIKKYMEEQGWYWKETDRNLENIDYLPQYICTTSDISIYVEIFYLESCTAGSYMFPLDLIKDLKVLTNQYIYS